jgi:hypothetical protein
LTLGLDCRLADGGEAPGLTGHHGVEQVARLPRVAEVGAAPHLLEARQQRCLHLDRAVVGRQPHGRA